MTNVYRILRWFTALTVGLLVLAVVVVGVLVGLLVLHFSAYRGALETLASRAVNRPVHIAGDMAVHPSLLPTMRVEGVRIGNPKWAPEPLMAEADVLAVRFDLFALLHGRLAIDRIVLIGANIVLERDAKGRANWNLQGGGRSGEAEGTVPAATLREIGVRRSRVTYRNLATGKRISLYVERAELEGLRSDKVELDLAGSYRGQPFTVLMHGGAFPALAAGDRPWPLHAELEVASTRVVAEGTMSWNVPGQRMSLDLSAQGKRLDTLAPLVERRLPRWGPYRVDAQVRQVGEAWRLDDLTARVGQSDLAGELVLRLTGPRPYLSGTLRARRIRLADFTPAESGAAAGPAAAGLDTPLPTDTLGLADLDLSLTAQRVDLPRLTLRDVSAAANLQAARLELSELALSLPGGRLRGSVRYDASGAVPGIRLRSEAAGFDYGRLVKALVGWPAVAGTADRIDVTVSGSGATVRELWQRGQSALRVSALAVEVPRHEGADAVRFFVDAGTAQIRQARLESLDAQGMYRGQPLVVKGSGGPLASLFDGRGPWPVTFAARSGDAEVQADGAIQWAVPGARFRFSGTLRGERLTTLDPLLAGHAPDWGPYRVTGQLAQTAAGVALTGMQARVGGSDLAGDLALSFDGTRPRLTGRVHARSIALADVRPQQDDPEGANSIMERPLPVSPLRAADVDVEVTGLGRAVLPGTEIEDAEGRIRLQAGQLELNPLSFDLQSMRVRGRAGYDARAAAPVLDGEFECTGCPYSRLLKAAGVDAPISGIARHARVTGTARGSTLQAMWLHAEGRAMMEGLQVSYATGKATSEDLQIDRALAIVSDGELQKLNADGAYRGQPLTLTVSGGALAALVAGDRTWPFEGRLTAPDTTLTVQGDTTWRHAESPFDVNLAVEGRRLSAINPLLLLDLPPFGPYRLSGRLQRIPGGYRLFNVQGNLGQSAAHGHLSIDLRGPRPLIEAQLISPALNLDDLEWERPQAAAEVTDADRSVGQRVIPDRPMPVDTLRRVDLNAQVQAEALREGDATIGDAAITVTVQDGRLELKPSRVRLFGATVFGSFTFDAGRSPPQVSMEVWAEKVDYGRLLKVYDLTNAFVGNADVGFKLDGTGADLRTFLAGANGSVEFVGSKGTVEKRYLEFWGVDILRWWQPLLDRSAQTNMNCAIAAFDIKDGLASSRVLMLDADKVVVEGEGTFNFANEQVDLELWPVPKRPSLFRVATPVQVQGPLASPSIGPAPKDVALDAAWLILGYTNPWALLLKFGSLGSYDQNPCFKAVTKAREGVARNGGEEPDIVARTKAFLKERFGDGGVPATP